MTTREFLAGAVFRQEELDWFLDPRQPSWARFDSELGYRLDDVLARIGLDNCYTINTYLPNDARRMIHYRDKPCRINTYGDSFTQCQQVSDGETWQEILAAHFGEPIRNFGVGGFGVYQAYRRIRRTEPTADGAPCVILNIYDDDHYRNLDMARWMRLSWKWPEEVRRKQVSAFHANPWAHLRLDQTTGRFIERENPFPTPESLYQLCDADFVYETFGQDEVVQLECLRHGGNVEDTQSLESLAEILEVAVDFQTPDAARQSAHLLFDVYALRATMFTVELATQFLQEHGKQLLILLSYGFRNVEQAILGEPRFDQTLIEFLQEQGLRHVDTRRSHVDDARAFRLNAHEYCQRYYIDGYGGHYSPLGNHFFAFAVKDALVKWLEPKPITY